MHKRNVWPFYGPHNHVTETVNRSLVNKLAVQSALYKHNNGKMSGWKKTWYTKMVHKQD